MKFADHVRSSHNQDGGVVLDILHGEMFHLNYVGSKILELLKQGYGEPEIAAHLAREFGIDLQRAGRDVHEFIETLEKHQLLTVRDNNSDA